MYALWPCLYTYIIIIHYLIYSYRFSSLAINEEFICQGIEVKDYIDLIESEDDFFMAMAHLVKERSKDPNTQVCFGVSEKGILSKRHLTDPGGQTFAPYVNEESIEWG